MASAKQSGISLTLQSSLYSSTRRRLAPRCLKREGGIFALNSAALLVVLLGFCALSLELSLVYNRKVELHGVSRAVALAAARELNGTQAGVDAALTQAYTTAIRFKYRYGTPVPWSSDAITFSTEPSGADWVDASTARLSPAGKYFVQVNAGPLLGEGAGSIYTPFLAVLPNAPAAVTVSDRAVAGRTAINITPLAICAMSSIPRAPRTNNGVLAPELVEYGFRRG